MTAIIDFFTTPVFSRSLVLLWASIYSDVGLPRVTGKQIQLQYSVYVAQIDEVFKSTQHYITDVMNIIVQMLVPIMKPSSKSTKV